MSPKIVYLHGVGTGDKGRSWLTGLNKGLNQAGHPSIGQSQVITPQYSHHLKADRVGRKMPAVTYKPRDDSAQRRDFELRQGKLLRRFNFDTDVYPVGWNKFPDPMVESVLNVAIGVGVLKQVKMYVENEEVRGAVLHEVLDHLPTSGEIILIGHSLGSVVAIDLLDHLHEDLHIRRFITIGSPGGSRPLHQHRERLLKKFPYGRVDDWTNFYGFKDIVPAGRGLAAKFPAAQDFQILTKEFHDSQAYLSHRSVSSLVSQILHPSKDLAVPSKGLAVLINDAEADTLLRFHFAYAIERKIKDKDAKERYRGARAMVQDDLVASWAASARAAQRPSPLELDSLIAGTLPDLPHYWETEVAVRRLTTLALTNILAPYEIEVGQAPMEALAEIAVAMGYTHSMGTQIGEAISTVDKFLNKRGTGVPWGKVLVVAGGLAMAAAGPVGLALAAPAGAFGGAAIVGGLAAFGPGGMIGGLAMFGGLAGAGMAVAGAAANPLAAAADPETTAAALKIKLAADYACKRLKLPVDDRLWYALAEAEAPIAAKINRIAPFSDPKAPTLVSLRQALADINRMFDFLKDNHMAPRLERLDDGGATRPPAPARGWRPPAAGRRQA